MKKKWFEDAALMMGIGGVLAACLYLVWVMAVLSLIRIGWLNIAPPTTDLMESTIFLAGVGVSLCGLILAMILNSENPLKRRR